MRFIEKAENDKRVRVLLKQLTRGAYSLDFDELEKEAETLHATRSIRHLKTKEVITDFQVKFIQAALQNQAYRSRMVEIKAKCFKVSAKLEEHLDVIKPYLRTKYAKSLSEFRTVADRNAAIERVLEKPIRHLQRLHNLDTLLEIYIKDFDQVSFGLKHIIDAMKLTMDRKDI